jgi:hypothetical protein
MSKEWGFVIVFLAAIGAIRVIALVGLHDAKDMLERAFQFATWLRKEWHKFTRDRSDAATTRKSKPNSPSQNSERFIQQ